MAFAVQDDITILRVSQWAHLVGLALGTLRSTRIGNAPPGQ